MNLTVLAVYAPTLDAVEGPKDSFYDDLQDAVGRIPAGDMLIAAGDWNARTCPVDTAYPGQVCSWHEVR